MHHAWEKGQLGPCCIFTISSAIFSIVGIGKGEGEKQRWCSANHIISTCACLAGSEGWGVADLQWPNRDDRWPILARTR